MREETVARSYAATLLALAERHEGMAVYGEASSLVANLLDEIPDFRLFLETPRISTAAKKAALEKAFSERVPTIFLNFLQVVLDKRRQRLLGAIAREYAVLVDERLGRTHAEVTVARPLGAESLARIEAALGPVLGGEVIAHERVDPGILGGVVVRSGDRVWDGSIRRRLEAMRTTLLHATLPEGPVVDSAGSAP